MNIHEYQAKEILLQYGVNIPKGYLVEREGDLENALRKIETNVAVIKAQVHTGGRGKAGGVRLVQTISQGIEEGTSLLNSQLVTHQTSEAGVKVRKIYIEEGCEIESEYYLSFVLNRNQGQIMVISSKAGGMSIEETAKNTPEAIKYSPIDPLVGLKGYQLRDISTFLEIPKSARPSFERQVGQMYKIYTQLDLNMIEINPLVLSKDEKILALDCKMDFDDNALFRHPEIKQLEDLNELDTKEVKARAHDLSYIALDGDIACMVNGAGLAMATLDSIVYAGGKPANFLDVGGSACEEKIKKAFEIILSDPNVKGIFINIFGGIMKCDVIAKGIVSACKNFQVQVPMVVRLEGSHELEGKKILQESGLDIYQADCLDEGAIKIVKAGGGE